MKFCFKCKKSRPIYEFYKHPKMKDGHLNKCKPCAKIDSLNHREKNIESIRKYDRVRANEPHRKIARNKVVKEYVKKYPLRKKANNMVSTAIRNGSLKKMPCVFCGKKAFAHHDDYSKPLDVVWLCQPHHKQRHKEISVSLK